MTIIVGDCREVLATLEAGSIDAIVTDPPYGIGFMSKGWDSFAGKHENGLRGGEGDKGILPGYGRGGTSEDRAAYRQRESRAFQAWTEAWATEAFRVLRPGGHLIAFGGTRTYHRMVCGIEDAGFEIRDQLAWLFGGGFPKSLDVGKQFDKQAGAEREVVGEHPYAARKPNGTWTGDVFGDEPSHGEGPKLTAPTTDAAKQWAGWGTGLKPAHEPIVLARKPLVGTVAANVAGHGTGALNIDACRIDLRGDYKSAANGRPSLTGLGDKYDPEAANNASDVGRWPANVVLDEEAAAMLDAQTGPSVSRIGNPRASAAPGDGWGMTATGAEYDDQGGPSRFFYCAKTSRAERNAGLEGYDERSLLWSSGTQNPGSFQADGTNRASRNNHPTVKPIALMRWLTRLVTPPAGIVLDPFTGSGTTGCACALEGFEFLGVELDPEYVRIAEARIAFWAEHGDEALRIVAESERSQAEREVIAESGQLDLLG